MGNKTKSASFRLDRKTIALIIIGVAALLCFIGLFGTILTYKDIVKSGGEIINKPELHSFNLKFIFSSGWEILRDLPAGAGIIKFGLVLMILSFFAGVGGCLYAIGKCVYSLIKKEDIRLKFNLSILLTSAVQYLFMSRFVLGYTGSKSIDTKSSSMAKTVYLMGWGGILITIGFFLALIALFVYECDNKKVFVKKSNVCKNIATAIIFFIGLYGITNISSTASTAQGSTITNTAISNSFSWISELDIAKYIAEQYGATVKNYTVGKTLAIGALIFGIISFISLATACICQFKDDESSKHKKITLISSIMFTATSLIANIMILVSTYLVQNSDGYAGTITINPGFSAIVGLILGIGLIVLVTVANKEKKFSKTK